VLVRTEYCYWLEHLVVLYSLVISCCATMSIEHSIFDVWIIYVNSAAYNWFLFTESFMCIACLQLYWLILASALSCHITLNPLCQCCFLLVLRCPTLLSSVPVLIFFSWIIFALRHMQLTIWMELENCNWGQLCFKREVAYVLYVSWKANLWKRIWCQNLHW